MSAEDENATKVIADIERSEREILDLYETASTRSDTLAVVRDDNVFGGENEICENEICEKFDAGAALAGYERHVLVHLLSLRVRFGARRLNES
jgi:hypothetical protein